jgi:hypothetical protein
MKRLLAIVIFIFLASCGAKEQVVIVVTATPPPPTNTSSPPTDTSPPPTPTDTPVPTPTSEPQWEPVAIENVEEALRNDGHRRYPFTTSDGLSAFTWVKENNYQRVTTYENGTIKIQVLHDKSQKVRAKTVERKLEVLDAVLPEEFMYLLRAINEDYNARVPGNVSGEPDQVFAYGDAWNTVWAEYEVEEIDTEGYSLRFSLWWWQSTCPQGYYCWYEDFPGLEFEGDSSFVFYTIIMTPINGGDFLSPSA